MKRTLGIGSGRTKMGNITVAGMRVWARKRRRKARGNKKGLKLPPIFYVTYARLDGKRVRRSTRQRRRNVAVEAAPIIAAEKQALLFPTVLETQPSLL